MASAKSIGFIGLGQMGARMARNLIKKNHRLVVHDISNAATAALKHEGAVVASSPYEVAEASGGTIITMLPSTPHVLETYCGPRGVLRSSAVRHSGLLIDCSTIEPGGARKVSVEAANLGARMIDAPVSGGITGAEAGTLTFMAGGDAAAVEDARPLLMCMGAKVFHTGGPGTGQVTKLCNNLALAISMIGTSEALQLGIRLGMDPKTLSAVMNTSTARCWSSDSYNPCPGVMEGVPSARGYSGGFASNLMAKDLGLAAEAAMTIKQPLPLAAAAHQLYLLMAARGMGSKDFSAVFDFLGQIGAEPPAPGPADAPPKP